jgi:hypothetical protein
MRYRQGRELVTVLVVCQELDRTADAVRTALTDQDTPALVPQDERTNCSSNQQSEEVTVSAVCRDSGATCYASMVERRLGSSGRDG